MKHVPYQLSLDLMPIILPLVICTNGIRLNLSKFTMDFGLGNLITEILVIALYGGNRYYKHT